MALRLEHDPHRRFNPLSREWVLVSPHRAQRPWQGHVDKPAPAAAPQYDPECYLCPGNARAGGVRNPPYTGTFVFENDFAALRPDTPEDTYDAGNRGLIRAEGERGICRVVCFSPRHDLTLATMQVAEIEPVVDLWVEQVRELGARPDINYVQVFENRGALMGASNPHPHCQVWSNSHLPNEPTKELEAQRAYAVNGACLLCDYLRLESDLGQRIVVENEEFAVLVPFWAIWPFETLVLPKRHVASLTDLSAAQRKGLAAALKAITATYDRVFNSPFPYSMGFHGAPTDNSPHPEWHLHAHFHPPLLRSATVRKFMVGYELLASPQRDITPESAAQRLRELAAALPG